MADFCTECNKRMGFPTPDIDIDKIFNSLKPGYYQQVLCEGCTLVAIAKTEKGELELADLKSQEFLPREEFFEKFGNYI